MVVRCAAQGLAAGGWQLELANSITNNQICSDHVCLMVKLQQGMMYKEHKQKQQQSASVTLK